MHLVKGSTPKVDKINEFVKEGDVLFMTSPADYNSIWNDFHTEMSSTQQKSYKLKASSGENKHVKVFVTNW